MKRVRYSWIWWIKSRIEKNRQRIHLNINIRFKKGRRDIRLLKKILLDSTDKKS